MQTDEFPMNETELKQLLTQLHQALAETTSLSPESQQLARDLDDDIHRVLQGGEADTSLTERAAALEAQFAANHPVAEGVLREIIDALGKMGI